VVVPQGQDVIPRRSRGDASCKDVIPRRPRGDASLLGSSSTVWWWCLIICIRIVKSKSLKWFGYIMCGYLLIMFGLNLPVECYNIMICYTSLPFRLLVCCVWLSPLRWSSILLMWADVRTPGSGNDSRDAAAWWLWTGIELTMGSAAEGVYLVRISLVLDKNLCCFWTIVLMIGSVVSLFFVMNRFGVVCTSVYQFPYSLDIYIYVRFIKLELSI